MAASKCIVCEKSVTVGQTIVGMPIIRITDVNKSAMAGTEILIHVACFLEKMGKPRIALTTT